MRRTKDVTIKAQGRDHGKTFLLTEMPAEEGEFWATRALELLETELDKKSEKSEGGMAALANAAASRAGINIARRLQDPSLDGMWKYVQFQPKDKEAPAQKLRDDHIEEWETRLDLRVAFFRLHVGFFSPENPSISVPASAPPNS
jgi:hypothetical protein